MTSCSWRCRSAPDARAFALVIFGVSAAAFAQGDDVIASTHLSHAVLIRGSFNASIVELAPRTAEVGVVGFESFGRAAVVTLRLRNACAVPFRGVFEAPLCVSFLAAAVAVAADDEALESALAASAVADLDDDVNVHGR